MSLTSSIQLLKRYRVQGHRIRHRPRWKSRARLQRFVPRLEILEDRAMLSTFTVMNLNDSGPDSLRQAVLDANDNPGADTINFAVSGTIGLTSGQMTITDDLAINGNGRITISGNHASRVFQIIDADPTDTEMTDVELKRLSIVDGFVAMPEAAFPSFIGGGGIQSIGSNLTLSHVTMTGNETFASPEAGGVATAGAVDSFLGGSLVVQHSRFYDNSAVGAILSVGGAIVTEGALTVLYSQFFGNEVTTLLGSGTLSPFQGAAAGGAISIGSGSDVSISHTHFTGNVARGGNGQHLDGIADGSGGLSSSGAIFASPISLVVPPAPVTLSVEHSTFTNNQAVAGPGAPGSAGGEASGGAIEATAFEVLLPDVPEPLIFVVTANVKHSKFLNNQSIGGAGGDGDGSAGGTGGRAWGGAYANLGSSLTVDQSIFHGNVAQGGTGGAGGAGANGGAGDVAHGGAISSSNNTLLAPDSRPVTVIRRSTFSGNTVQGGAGGAGGAGANGGNGGTGFGGAIDHELGTMAVSGSLVVANRVVGGAGGGAGIGGLGGHGGDGLGGGIANGFEGIFTVSSSLVLANRATGGDGPAGGGNGGNGHGGGLFNAADAALTITDSWIVGNRAKAGAAGAGGTDGESAGGGIYNNMGAIDIDARTHVFANFAELFPNCFGC